jgi:hypothetical protein
MAHRHVADLAASRDDLQTRLARVCLEAAARRYVELVDVLARRRYQLPPSSDEEPPE